MTNTEISSDRLEEVLDEILDEDAPNKDVWKTHASQDEWLREKILPVLRQLRRDRRGAGGEAVAWMIGDKITTNAIMAARYPLAKPLYLHPSNSGVAVKALEEIDRLLPNYQSHSATDHGRRQVLHHLKTFISALHPSPDTGKSQAVPLIDNMSEEEFNRDRSDENPNVGKKDPEGTWSDGGKEWTPEAVRKFNIGDRVTKAKGSSWTGHVVGFYRTSLTPIGYAIESENEPGSVQIYPESALDIPK